MKLFATFIFFFISMNIAVAFATTSIPFSVNLSEAVYVTGLPYIPIDVGGTTRYANYISGSGTSILTFEYTLVAGDVDLDGVAVASPIILNGGTIKDAAGNDASLTFTPPNTSGVKIDYYIGVLENLPTTVAAYSVRRLKRSYKGALIRVRRSSDNSESDIGYLVNGGLDTASLLSFCSSTNCFIKTWYDQSGNLRNATQTTISNQPRIVNAGVLDVVNTVPTVNFLASSSTYLLIPSALSGLSSMTISTIFKNNTSGNWARIFDFGTGTNVNMFATPSNSVNSRFRITTTSGPGEQGISAAPIINSTTSHSLFFLHSGSTMSMFQDGASLSSIGSITISPSAIVGANNYIGKSQYPDSYLNAGMQEFIIFSSSLSTIDRNALEANQKSYFSTP